MKVNNNTGFQRILEKLPMIESDNYKLIKANVTHKYNPYM